jgi:hypothetical protein
MTAPNSKDVAKLLQHHRGLIARMTPEQRQRLRDSFRPQDEVAIADGDLNQGRE